jgi:uncharacterized membrane protein YkvA (DUF1232 family)
MEEKQKQTVAQFDEERAERFYSRLRRRIAEWLDKNTKASPKVRDYLLLLPDLFALLIRLIRDPRVATSLKVQLIAVSAYVISPIDLVPDVLLPAGLIDDTVAVAFILSRVVKIMGDAGEEVLREHWEGQGDVLAQIRKVVDSADSMLSSGVLQRLRKVAGGS